MANKAMYAENILMTAICLTKIKDVVYSTSTKDREHKENVGITFCICAKAGVASLEAMADIA